MPATRVTPVTVLTGFLGSGKSTLVNRIVADARFARTVVVVNEWGEVPIDHALVCEGAEKVVAIAGGCICCRMSSDLVGLLRELHFQRAEGKLPDFERVVVETSGLADPGPMLAALADLPLLAARYALAGVVTTLDAQHGERALDEHPEAARQVAMADRIVVTKCDLAPPRTVAALEARARALNPAAAVLRSAGADVDAARLMEAGLDCGGAAASAAAGWLGGGGYRHHGTVAHHTHGLETLVARFEEPLAWDGVEASLGTLLARHGERILRLKGLVNVAGEAGPRAVHAVGHTLYPSARLAAWPDADRSTRLVIIGRGLEEAGIAGMLQSSAQPAPTHR